jgi:hypothetical protein
MRTLGRQKAWLAVSCLLSVGLALRNTTGYEGSEFSGGWLTGPLLTMAEIGILLFFLAFVATLRFPRCAASIGTAASLVCLPM